MPEPSSDPVTFGAAKMSEIELMQKEIIRTLCVIGDRDFLFARKYMEDAGFDLRSNGVEAREWCLSKSEAGDAGAQFAMAKLYLVGLWGEANRKEALRWCQEAEASDFLPAKHMLASFYEEGIADLEIDLERAKFLRQEAADQGDVGAMRSIATDLLLGIHGQKDRMLALHWLRRAAETGDADSQCFLANELFKSGDAESNVEGMKWVMTAAEQNYPAAHFHIGHYYWQGSNNFPVDRVKAAYHLDLAARLEEDSCATLIGS